MIENLVNKGKTEVDSVTTTPVVTTELYMLNIIFIRNFRVHFRHYLHLKR